MEVVCKHVSDAFFCKNPNLSEFGITLSENVVTFQIIENSTMNLVRRQANKVEILCYSSYS